MKQHRCCYFARQAEVQIYLVAGLGQHIVRFIEQNHTFWVVFAVAFGGLL